MASQDEHVQAQSTFLLTATSVCFAIILLVFLTNFPKAAPKTAASDNAAPAVASTASASKPTADSASKPTLEPKSEVTAAKPVTATQAPATDTKPTEYLPAGNGLPTLVTIEDSGGSAAPVQRVEFLVGTPFKTPARAAGKAQKDAIAVAFAERNYDAKGGKFSLALKAPPVTPVNYHAAPLALTIVWPKYAGWTYRGKLEVISAGQQPVEVKNVEVDIVKAPAK